MDRADAVILHEQSARSSVEGDFTEASERAAHISYSVRRITSRLKSSTL